MPILMKKMIIFWPRCKKGRKLPQKIILMLNNKELLILAKIIVKNNVMAKKYPKHQKLQKKTIFTKNGNFVKKYPKRHIPLT